MSSVHQPSSVHFMDPIDDAVNAAQLHTPRGTGELLNTVGTLEDVLKGLAYIVGSAEYGYLAEPSAAEGLAYRHYPGEEELDADVAKTELLQLLVEVRVAMEQKILPAVGRAAHLAERLYRSDGRASNL